jgi:hypothetical protein
MYRDEVEPAFERLERVRAQVAAARRRPPDEPMRELARQRRDRASLRRKIRRLRHPLLRWIPVTLSEIGYVANHGAGALAIAVVAWLLVAAPFFLFVLR